MTALDRRRAHPRDARAEAGLGAPVVSGICVLVMLIVMGTAGCGGTSVQADTAQEERRTAWRAALSKARSLQIERLDEYRHAAAFPTNHRVLGELPVFIDEYEVPCAVAYLMQKSGWRKVVEDVAANDNNVYIERIRSGPILDWIRTSGLTQEEAALIQPKYGFLEPPAVDPPSHEKRLEERRRLNDHFFNVLSNILWDAESSLDVATERLLGDVPAWATPERVAAGLGPPPEGP
jgi:hypothetical protein